jgi:predicted Zn-dependent protease
MKPQTMELIERYLNDELSAEERKQAEQRMSFDPEFKRKLEVFREFQQMYSEESQSFRTLLKEVDEEYQQDRKPKNSYWLIAASVSLIGLLAAAYFLFLSPAPQPEELYAQNFSLPADNLTVRGDEDQQLLNEAMVLYSDRQFDEALQRFDAWEAQHTDSIPVMFYSAISQMALGEMKPAITQLRAITLDRSANASYSAASHWYLALAYLKAKQVSEARSLLQDLAGVSSSYATKARNLLDQL